MHHYEAYLAAATDHHKFKVLVVDLDTDARRTILFGDSAYEDFTTHRDEARRQRYLARHSARENWSNPMTAGFWARNILWNKPTIRESIADTKRRYGISIYTRG